MSLGYPPGTAWQMLLHSGGGGFGGQLQLPGPSAEDGGWQTAAQRLAAGPGVWSSAAQPHPSGPTFYGQPPAPPSPSGGAFPGHGASWQQQQQQQPMGALMDG